MRTRLKSGPERARRARLRDSSLFLFYLSASHLGQWYFESGVWNRVSPQTGQRDFWCSQSRYVSSSDCIRSSSNSTPYLSANSRAFSQASFSIFKRVTSVLKSRCPKVAWPSSCSKRSSIRGSVGPITIVLGGRKANFLPPTKLKVKKSFLIRFQM